MDEQLAGREIHVTGVVQGVGFRPFVYGLAQEYELMGWVRNTSAGVDIVVDGRISSLDSFTYDLEHKLPPLARMDSCAMQERPCNGFTQFEIMHSEPIEGAFQPISPDVFLCPDCLRELFDPQDRRYLYPFINCTNCGPRFTIIQDIPYDRPKTTMSPFAMCPACAEEYHNPLDRRFHAQPVACPECGPEISFQFSVFSGDVAGGKLQVASNYASRIPVLSNVEGTHHAIDNAQSLLADGQILAIKGLGGFHLACDALNDTAVSTLRERKNRVDKPFAVMMRDVETVEQYCFLTEAERELLTHRERPIVLLKQKPNTGLSPNIAPKQNTLGVMLPYTPLHHLILHPSSFILVMTSGNLSEEPIAYTNEDAIARLSNLADAFLLHNRDIHVRCDDSVVARGFL